MLSFGEKNNKPFIITIDTEGDNIWACKDIRKKPTTNNAKYLFRFQELCEKYGFIPTYLTNYEMARDDAMRELGREGLKRKTLEIGAHEHAWNQPPYYPLIKGIGKRGQPYLKEYPKAIIHEKLKNLTILLEDSFQCNIQSHRGGRWCMTPVIAEELIELGYSVDCTCTPGVSWKNTPGWRILSKGDDWRDVFCSPFFIETKSTKKGKRKGRILEVPVTIIDQKGKGHYSWLRPDLNNKKEMIALLEKIKNGETEYAEFMLHSSELMPGGSPTFKNKGQVECLYDDITEVFEYARENGYVGIGLSEFAECWYNMG